MAKFRINGKFVTLKEFVKVNGTDSVLPHNLNAKEKRILNGLKSYENRIKLDNGQFVNKVTLSKLKRDSNLKIFAEKNNMSLNDYLRQNIDTILKFNSQAFQITKNQNNVEKFINQSNGNFKYKGKLIDKNELIQKLQKGRISALKKNKFITIYTFEIKDNGHKINLTEIKKMGSDDKE